MGNMKKEEMSKELLKLASDKYMEERGKFLLEEYSRIDKKNVEQPTEKQMKEFRKICHREFRKKNRSILFFYKIATSAAVVLLAFNVSAVSVPGVKRVVLNFLTSSEKTHTRMNINDGERSSANEETEQARYKIGVENEYRVTYLPEGFEIEREEKISRVTSIYYKYKDNYIIFIQGNDSSTVNIDTEGALVDYIEVDGGNAVLSERDNTISIAWRKNDCFINISSNGLDKDKLIKVARSIKKVD